MPNSLKCRLKSFAQKGYLSEKDLSRIYTDNDVVEELEKIKDKAIDLVCDCCIYANECPKDIKCSQYTEFSKQINNHIPKEHTMKFEGIVVEYPPADLCTYPEYKGKPYFSIKYEKDGEHIIGFGTYKPEVLSRYIQEYFITPTIIEADKAEVEPNTGYWVEEIINEWSRKVFCSKCGCTPPFEHISDGDVYSSSGYGVINKTKFCPNCGIKMVEPQESEDKLYCDRNICLKNEYNNIGCDECIVMKGETE